MRRANWVAGIAVLCLAAGCASPPPGPHPLTMPEAERLAMVRYTNYEAGVSSVTARVPTDAGVLTLNGRVDFVHHVGHVLLSTADRSDIASTGLLQWNPRVIAFRSGTGQKATEPVPLDGWQLRALQGKGSELDAVLLLLLNIAVDRPDNAQLLLRSGARWVRADVIAGTPVDLFEGPTQGGQPSRLTYWVDRDGNLHRLDVRLGDRATRARITFSPGAPPITPLPAISGR